MGRQTSRLGPVGVNGLQDPGVLEAVVVGNDGLQDPGVLEAMVVCIGADSSHSIKSNSSSGLIGDGGGSWPIGWYWVQ